MHPSTHSPYAMRQGRSHLPLRPSQSFALHRQCACGGATGPRGECAECKAKREAGLQRNESHPAPGSTGPANTAPPIVHDVLRSPGQPLDPGTRAFMEPRFGQDLGGVRVHADAKAAASARAVNALAYTVGRDVVFGAGQYAPGTGDGKRLIAHELTHVVQQGMTLRRAPDVLPISEPRDASEQEAASSAEAVVRGESVQALQSDGALLRREPTDAGATDAQARDSGASQADAGTVQADAAPDASASAQAGAAAPPSSLLIYASGYANIYNTVQEEHSNPNWMPSSDDFQATAQGSGGGTGLSSFTGMLGQIQGAPAGSIKNLELIGHANQNVFALGGTISKGGGVSATTAGTIDKPTLDTAVQNGTIPPLRSRFAPGAAITLYACHAGAAGTLLTALSNAFQVCARGFTTELEWCLRSTTTTIVSRGHVRQKTGARPTCVKFPASVYSLTPDKSDCSGASSGGGAPTPGLDGGVPNPRPGADGGTPALPQR